ncbi:hypothetical protein M2406_004124 [Serratia sp. BIGb0163]|nr:hypothetical protein [Serratia sp. BIGb0163]
MAITSEKREFMVLRIKYNSMKNRDNRDKKGRRDISMRPVKKCLRCSFYQF